MSTLQENYVLVNQSLDPDLLSFYNSNENDMHSFIASKIYPHLQGLTLSEIKNQFPDLRNIAKSAGFAISYGGNGFTVSANLGISEQEGEMVYNSYFKGFPGLRKYYDELIEKSLKQGYILIDPITGRRRNFAKPSNKKEESAIGRKALNSPVQGCSGGITKLALIMLDDFFTEYNLHGVAKITNAVHDEIIVDCCSINLEVVERVANLLEKAMVDAAYVYCKTVPLKADAVITPYWTH